MSERAGTGTPHVSGAARVGRLGAIVGRSVGADIPIQPLGARAFILRASVSGSWADVFGFWTDEARWGAVTLGEGPGARRAGGTATAARIAVDKGLGQGLAARVSG